MNLDEFLGGSEMGDRTPSEFFTDMMNIVGGSQVSQDLLLKLWKRRLPKPVLVAITASGKESVNDIVDLADRIWESYQLPNYNKNFKHVSSITSSQGSDKIVHKTNNQLISAFNDFSVNTQDILQKLSQQQSILKNQFQLYKINFLL